MAKEFRYFQILIVKTAIHHSISSGLVTTILFFTKKKKVTNPFLYTTWHWAEFTTYTNTFRLSKLLCFW